MPDPSAIWTRGNDKHLEWGGKKLALKDMKPHYLNDFIIAMFQQQGNYANLKVNTKVALLLTISHKLSFDTLLA